MDHAAADVETRGKHLRRTEPLHGEDAANNVDDQIEIPDFVQVHTFDRHGVNRGLGLSETPEERDGARTPGRRQRRCFDHRLDLREAPMFVQMRVRV